MCASLGVTRVAIRPQKKACDSEERAEKEHEYDVTHKNKINCIENLVSFGIKTKL